MTKHLLYTTTVSHLKVGNGREKNENVRPLTLWIPRLSLTISK